MSLSQAIILGAIQGFTEFLPVSSSGHLIFIPAIFGWQDQGLAFDIVVHLGTLIAVLIYTKKILIRLFSALFVPKKETLHDRRLAIYLLVSVVPVALVGLFLGSNIRSHAIIGVSFIVWGIVLWFGDRYSKTLPEDKKVSTLKKTNTTQIMWMSAAQVLALIPGTSRSGITMTAGLFGKLSKKMAAEISFLMAIPVIGAASMLTIKDMLDVGVINTSFPSLIVGFLVSCFTAMLAMRWLVSLVEKWGFAPFAYYRIIVGVIILLVLV
tara:strand:+ start:2258 stop:3058 length:801 start_codon:yes stop_codon:yes gene_type:complete